jgi:hypothetical protein
MLGVLMLHSVTNNDNDNHRSKVTSSINRAIASNSISAVKGENTGNAVYFFIFVGNERTTKKTTIRRKRLAI